VQSENLDLRWDSNWIPSEIEECVLTATGIARYMLMTLLVVELLRMPTMIKLDTLTVVQLLEKFSTLHEL
jgi:hypothetical protein